MHSVATTVFLHDEADPPYVSLKVQVDDGPPVFPKTTTPEQYVAVVQAIAAASELDLAPVLIAPMRAALDDLRARYAEAEEERARLEQTIATWEAVVPAQPEESA